MSPGRGGDVLNGDQAPLNPKPCRGRCSSLAAFQLVFTAIVIYLFILCLLVVPGLILDQPVLEECHDKGFAGWLGMRNSECGSVWGHLGLPFVFLKCYRGGKGSLSS